MNLPSRAPKDIDVNRPSPARVHDHALGGARNFEVVFMPLSRPEAGERVERLERISAYAVVGRKD